MQAALEKEFDKLRAEEARRHLTLADSLSGLEADEPLIRAGWFGQASPRKVLGFLSNVEAGAIYRDGKLPDRGPTAIQMLTR